MGRRKLLSTEIVLNRALELAKENGINAVTYNGLARELDIRPQSMYRYVSDIRELRVWLLSRFLDELVEGIAASMEGLEPRAALRAFGVSMYDFCHANPRYYETFQLMHTYDIIEDLRQPLLDLANLVQGPMEQLEGATEEAKRHTQLYVAVNLGYAQMAMTKFIPTSLQDDRRIFLSAIDEFVEKILTVQKPAD